MFVGPAALAAALLAVASVGHAEEAAKAHGTASISGKVTGVDGHPAAGIEVRLMAGHAGGKDKKTADAPADKPKRMEALATVKTDDQGAYKFDNLAAGTYVVQAGDHKTMAMGKEKVTLTDGQAATADIKLEAKGADTGGEKKKKN